MKPLFKLGLVALASATFLTGCPTSDTAEQPKNLIFFLGDGMGMTDMTAARIYSVGEDGDLTMDTLPESAFVRTYSKDAMVTDSAPSMAAYMTGVKMNNEVISMSADTSAYNNTGSPYVNGADSTCPTTGNGTAARTILEIAKAAGRSVGVVSTARITHATPAATYAHICHRDGENDIAAQLVKGSGLSGTSAYNTALADGVDVLLGGGRKHFLPSTTTGSARTDNVDLIAKLKGNGYTYVADESAFKTVDPAKTDKLLGLFTSSHMTYDLQRDATKEPSLSEMSQTAVKILSKNKKGFFLMVEGGRIDHALHETTAQKALGETIAFDNAIKDVMAQMQTIDPGLKNTLIVVTADHDHTMVLNGYAKRTGKTVDATQLGVLGFVKNVITGGNVTDANGNPYTIIGFGIGENAPTARGMLSDSQVFDINYHQEATIPSAAGSETHGGADVYLGATGTGADQFKGVITNTEVFNLMKNASKL